MSGKYILDKHDVVECDDLMTWAKWYGTADRGVALDQKGDVEVSTIFLGIDHQFGDGPPLLFETMVFGSEHDQYTDRYSTWEEAEAGHKQMCEKVFN